MATWRRQHKCSGSGSHVFPQPVLSSCHSIFQSRLILFSASDGNDFALVNCIGTISPSPVLPSGLGVLRTARTNVRVVDEPGGPDKHVSLAAYGSPREVNFVHWKYPLRKGAPLQGQPVFLDPTGASCVVQPVVSDFITARGFQNPGGRAPISISCL